MKPIKYTNKTIQSIMDTIQTKLKDGVVGGDKLTLDLKDMFPKQNIRPTIIFSAVARDKMKALVDASNKELAWHATVSRNKKKHSYIIEDVFVFPQEVTAVTVTSVEDKYGPWLMSMNETDFNKLRFHGHSHVNMGVTPSGTDLSYQEEMLDVVEDFYIYFILNKKGDFFITLFEVDFNMQYDKKDMLVVFDNNLQDKWAEDMVKGYIKDKPRVVTPAHSYTAPSNRPGNGYYTQYQLDQIDNRKNKKPSVDEYSRAEIAYMDRTYGEGNW